MSLVIAIKLENDDVLFVADKRCTTLGPSGYYVSHADEQSTKVIPMFGGVMGFAGNQTVAISLLSAIQTIVKTAPPSIDLEYEITKQLGDAYFRYVPPALQEEDGWFAPQAKNDQVEFIFAVRSPEGCRITTFSLDELFRPKVCYDSIVKFTDPKQIYGNAHLVMITGAEHHARMLLHWFNKKTYSLEEAKRLALVMVAITNDANPSLVNKHIDAMLLTDSKAPVSVDCADAVKWVEGFMKTTKDALYAP